MTEGKMTPKEQFELGRMYSLGAGVPQSHRQAAKWYRKAAERGFAYAQLRLGVAYFFGIGVTKNYKHGQAWLDKAFAGDELDEVKTTESLKYCMKEACTIKPRKKRRK